MLKRYFVTFCLLSESVLGFKYEIEVDGEKYEIESNSEETAEFLAGLAATNATGEDKLKKARSRKYWAY